MIASTYMVQMAAVLVSVGLAWVALDNALTGRFVIAGIDVICCAANAWTFCQQANFRRHLKRKSAMTFGPGKYDDLCTLVREKAGVNDIDGGAVVVIIIGGNQGPGFAIQADFKSAVALPDMLEMVAKQMRKDIAG